jgi:hypothetical protein
MKKLCVVLAYTLAIGSTAFGYVMSGAFPYDGLAIYDQCGAPVRAGALRLAVSPTYLIANKLYDGNGDVQDLGFEIPGTGEFIRYDQNFVAVPVDVGYGLTDNIQLDVTFQILRPKLELTTGESADAFGLGDIWVKGRWVAPVGDGCLGGRLAVKMPVGKSKNLAVDELPLGDGQFDVDVAAVGSFAPEGSGFVGNGQVGYRYRTAKSETVIDPEDPTRTVDVDLKKGMIVYALLEPGYGFGEKKRFRVGVPILYEASTAVELDGLTVADSETNGLAVGVSPTYAPNANNAIGFKVLYPVSGKNVYKALTVALTYEGYIPL